MWLTENRPVMVFYNVWSMPDVNYIFVEPKPIYDDYILGPTDCERMFLGPFPWTEIDAFDDIKLWAAIEEDWRG